MNRFEYSVNLKQSPKWIKLMAVLCLPLAVVCFSNFSTGVEAGRNKSDEYRAFMVKYRRPSEIPYPKSNQFSKERELLGRTLFFDPRLSESNWISCATCHNPAFS